MHKIIFILIISISTLWSNFNFGECSGSGTFEQQIIHYGGDYENTTLVGQIPQGIEGLRIELISDKDVDIRLYGENEDKIVHWPYGLLSHYYQQTKPYKDIPVTYSGYNGVNGEKGHEFIEVNGTTPTTMTMKAFGYRAGYATVNYSWTGKVGCTVDESGTGSFTQTLVKDTTSLVGTIPPNVNNVQINLTSNKDLDIQLYGADGTAIASWKPIGLMAGPIKQSIMYHNMNITWSGYNGTDGQAGHEYIKIEGDTTEVLVMKVFGYEAGSADVTYSWGSNENNETTHIVPKNWEPHGINTTPYGVSDTHNGDFSLKITNEEKGKSWWYGKTIPVDNAKTLTFSGWSKSENVSSDALYSLSFLLKFDDGSLKWYDTNTKFNTGTHDWQEVNTTVTFDKPVVSVMPATILFYASGTAWFDEVSVQASTPTPTSNNIPTAKPQSVTTNEDNNKTVTLIAEDADGDSVTYTITQQPSHGALTGTAPTLVYVPTENFNGSDSIKFKVNDGKADSNEATITIKVNSVNDAPTANAGTDKSIIENNKATLTCSGSDLDGTIATYEWYKNSNRVGSGKSYTTPLLSTGEYTYTCVVTDNEGAKGSDSVNVNVVESQNADTTPPVITLNGDTTTTLEQNSNYTELGATAVDAVDGSVDVKISGSVDVSTIGEYTITYRAIDKAGNTASITRTIKVIQKSDNSTDTLYVTETEGDGDYTCNGTQDQIGINEALDRVASDDKLTTVYLKGPMTCIIDEPILISSNTKLIGDSNVLVKLKDHRGWNTPNKPVIGQKNDDGTVAWSQGSIGAGVASNMEVAGFELSGGVQDEQTGKYYVMLMSFYDVENLKIHGMNLHDSRGDIIRIFGSDIDTAKNIKIYNNTISRSGHEGMYIIDVDQIDVHDNKIYETRTNTGINFATVKNFSIYNNTIGNDLTKSPSGYAGIFISSSGKVSVGKAEVYNNYIYGKNGGIILKVNGGIDSKDTIGNVHIHHNRLYKINNFSDDGVLNGAIRISGYNNSLIEYNTIEASKKDGIVYYEQEGTDGRGTGFETIIRNNIISNCRGYGINNLNPEMHSFVSENNNVFNNTEGEYNNVSSSTDIHVDPLYANSEAKSGWSHLVATYDSATERFKIYINGKEKANEKFAGFGSLGTNGYVASIGTYLGLDFFPLKGNLDDMAVWERAISAEEVLGLWNHGKGNDIDLNNENLTHGLKAYWKMENSWSDSFGSYNADDSSASFSQTAKLGTSCGKFAGDNNRVLFSKNLSPTTALTISTWIYRDKKSYNGNTIESIFNKGNESKNNHIWLYAKGDHYYFELGNGNIRREISAASAVDPKENLDLHLKSVYGRWNGSIWVTDTETSPAIDQGKPSSDYLNELNPNGERVNLGAYGNTDEASKSKTGIPGADTTPPILTLLGDKTVTLIAGDTYTDAGATATDNKDGDITSHIKVAGLPVDTSVAGTYTITYSVSDTEGNIAKNISRVVNIEAKPLPDTTPPVITLNGASTMALIQNTHYVEQGATAEDAVDGAVNVTISGSVDSTKIGKYTITYTAVDKEENSAVSTRVVRVIEKQENDPSTLYVTIEGAGGDYTCNGTQDQIGINEALDRVASDDKLTTVYLRGPMTCIIDEPILISSNTKLIGDSNVLVKLKDHRGWNTLSKPLIGQKNSEGGAEWELHDGYNAPGGTDSASNIEIAGFELSGGIQSEDTGKYYVILINFYDPKFVKIHDMNLHDSRGDIIRFFGRDVGKAHDLEVYNNIIKDSGHEGIYFIYPDHIKVYNNEIYDTRTNAGIRVGTGSNFSIYNNTIANDLTKTASGNAGILVASSSLTPVGKAEIYNNYIYGKSGGIILQAGSGSDSKNTLKDVHIHHNRLYKINSNSDDGYQNGAIRINGFHRTLIEYNTIEASKKDGIVFDEYSNGKGNGYQTIVRNNIISNCKGYGINNQNPEMHTFVSENNDVFSNTEGAYNNVSSSTDIHTDPLYANTKGKSGWAYLVATYDSTTERFIIYVNGKEAASEKVEGFGGIGNNTHPASIGTYLGLDYFSLKGKLDDMAIWERALSASEVKKLWNNGNGKDIDLNSVSLTNKLLAYWNMDNNWKDSFGNYDGDNDKYVYSDAEEHQGGNASFSSDARLGSASGEFAGGFNCTRFSSNLSPSSALTISTWIYIDKEHPSEDSIQTIFNKGAEETNDFIWLYIKENNFFLELGSNNGNFRHEINAPAGIDPQTSLDFHLKSEYGRWNGNAWIADSVTSPAIDAGKSSSDYSKEPTPNGGKVNLGAYGNTKEASKSQQ